MEQAAAFYTNLLGDADLIAEMGNFDHDRARLEADGALVQAVVDANLVQRGGGHCLP